MRTKYFLIIAVGTLACMLVMDGLVLQPLMNHGPNLVYASHHGPNPGNPGNPGNPDPNPAPLTAATEPAAIFLLGAGLLILAGYGRKKFLKK